MRAEMPRILLKKTKHQEILRIILLENVVTKESKSMTLLKSDSRYHSKLEKTDSENAQSECVAIMIGFKNQN
jgi:hypothetical protein